MVAALGLGEKGQAQRWFKYLWPAMPACARAASSAIGINVDTGVEAAGVVVSNGLDG
jgi:hypothetical protein